MALSYNSSVSAEYVLHKKIYYAEATDQIVLAIETSTDVGLFLSNVFLCHVDNN
jgi:hypothetical protein